MLTYRKYAVFFRLDLEQIRDNLNSYFTVLNSYHFSYIDIVGMLCDIRGLSMDRMKKLQRYLQQNSAVKQAIVFGSLAKHSERFDSDIDLAIELEQVMDADDKSSLIEDIAMITGRAVDLIDLKKVGQPLLGQILHYGKRLVGDDSVYAALLGQYLLDQADFLPYRQRILAVRRQAWIGH